MAQDAMREFADMAASPMANKLASEPVREIGMMVREFLQNAVADAGSHVDSGFGFGEFDCCVKVRGAEYWVVVKPPLGDGGSGI